MKQKEKQFILLVANLSGGVTAIFVALTVIGLLEIPSRFFLALTMAVLSLSIYKYVRFGRIYTSISLPRFFSSISNPRRGSIRDWFFAIFYAFSIVVSVLPGTSQSLYTNWIQIPAVSWLRLVAAISLASLLPGFAILTVLDEGKRMGKITKLIFSFLLSLFFTSLLSFALVSAGQSFVENAYLLAIFNIIILVSFVISILRRRKNEEKVIETETRHLTFDFYGVLIILCIIALLSISLFSVFFANESFIKGDMFNHFYTANFIFSDGIKNSQMSAFMPLSYPYWFQLFLASLFSLSNFPPINLYLTLFLFNMIHIGAFYLMASAFFDKYDRRVPKIATVIWATFSGFSWIYVLSLKMQSDTVAGGWFGLLQVAVNKDIQRLLYPFGFNMAGILPAYIGSALLFMLLYLMIDNRLSISLRCFLTTILVALSALIHGEETAILLILFVPAFSIFLDRISPSKMRRILFSMALGLVAVIVIDHVAPRMNYTVNQPIQLYFVVIALVFAFTYIKEKIRTKVPIRAIGSIVNKIKLPILLLFWYIYGLSFIVLYEVAPNFYTTYVQASGLIPWYFYPFIMGTAGLLLLVGLTYFVLRKDHVNGEIICLLVVIISTFILGKILSYTSLSIGMREERLLRWLFVPLAMMAGLTIIHLFSKKLNYARTFKGRFKILSTSFLLFIVLTSGVLTSLLAADYWTWVGGTGIENGHTSGKEIDGLNFLNYNTSRSSWVITLSDDSYKKVELTGRKALTYRWLLFEASRPETVLSLFSGLPGGSYIYLSSQDMQIISKSYNNSYFVQHFVSYLPIAFRNSEVTIFNVPVVSPPSDSDLGILDFSQSPSAITNSCALDIVALSQLRYQITLDTDNNIFNFSTLIFPADVAQTGNSVRVIADDNQVKDKFWASVGESHGSIGIPILTDDSGIKEEGNNSLKVAVESGDYATWTLRHDYASPVDWSTQDALYLYFYGSSTGKQLIFRAITTTPKVDYYYHVFKDVSPGWERVFLPLSEFSGVGTPSWRNISRIEFGSYDSNVSGTWYLDSIATEKSSSLPILSEHDIPRYLQWVTEGGRLIVLNSLGHGLFADALSISTTGTLQANGIRTNADFVSIPKMNVQQTVSADKNVTTIANFMLDNQSVSPYAYAKKNGKGEIVYIEVAPYLLNISDEQNLEMKRQYFAQLASLIKVLDLRLPVYSPSPTFYLMNALVSHGSELNITGDIELESNYFHVQDLEHVRIDWLNLSLAKNIVINGVASSSFGIREVTIRSLQIDGPTMHTIVAKQAFVNAGIRSNYLVTEFDEGFTWIIDLLNSSTVSMNIWNGSSLDIMVQGGVIKLSLASSLQSDALVRTPAISVQGYVTFENVYAVYVEDGKLPDYIYKGRLSGSTRFKVNLLDKYLVMANFSTTGDVDVIIPPSPSWDELNLPWNKVLTTPCNIGLIIILITFGLVYYLRRYHVHIRVRKLSQ